MNLALFFSLPRMRVSNSGPFRATNCAVLSTIARMSGGGVITPTACVCVSSSTRAPPSTFTERASRPASFTTVVDTSMGALISPSTGANPRASVRRDPTEQSPVDQLARRDSEQGERARHASAPDPAARIGVGSLKAGEDGNWRAVRRTVRVLDVPVCLCAHLIARQEHRTDRRSTPKKKNELRFIYTSTALGLILPPHVLPEFSGASPMVREREIMPTWSGGVLQNRRGAWCRQRRRRASRGFVSPELPKSEILTTNHRKAHTELVHCVVIVSSSFGSKKIREDERHRIGEESGHAPILGNRASRKNRRRRTFPLYAAVTSSPAEQRVA